MPLLNELDNFAAAGNESLSNQIKFVQQDVDSWLSDVSSSLTSPDYVRASAEASEMMRNQILAPMGATIRTATQIGVYDIAWGPTLDVLSKSYDLLKDAYEWIGGQLKSFIQGVIEDLMEIISPALDAVFQTLSVVSSTLKCIPWIGSLVSGMIDGFRTWKGLLAKLAGGDPGKGSCQPFNWNGPKFAGADVQNAKQWFSRIGGDVTELFLPPEIGSYELRKMNIQNPKGDYYESEQEAGMHGYAPGVGPISCFSSYLPYLGPEPTSGSPQDVIDRYDMASGWFLRNGQTIKPWVPNRDHPDPSGKKRWNAYPLFQAPNGGGGIYQKVPIDPYRKTTAICLYAFQQCTGTGPQALMVDWGSVADEWMDYTLNFPPGESRSPLPNCEGTVYNNSRIPAFNRYFGALGNTIYMYESRSLIMRSGLSFYSGEGIIPDERNEFFEWMTNKINTDKWAPEIAETGYTIPDPLSVVGTLNPWEAPLSIYSGIWYVKYVCDTLKRRQVRLASTDASAYVKSDVLAGMASKRLRDAIEESRARILAGGGVGIDMDMAYAADPAFANAVKSRKGKALMGQATAVPPDLPSINIYSPQDWSPSPSPQPGRDKSMPSRHGCILDQM